MEKIHIEELIEKANKWFDSLLYQRDNIVLKAYMNKFGIKEKDIEW